VVGEAFVGLMLLYVCGPGDPKGSRRFAWAVGAQFLIGFFYHNV
jgi:hypothetical protein